MTGEEGEILVFRAAVSWLEVETLRERDSDQVGFAVVVGGP